MELDTRGARESKEKKSKGRLKAFPSDISRVEPLSDINKKLQSGLHEK